MKLIFRNSSSLLKAYSYIDSSNPGPNCLWVPIAAEIMFLVRISSLSIGELDFEQEGREETEKAIGFRSLEPEIK